MNANVNPINRTLAYKHDDQQWRVIAQGDIAAIAKPVVILGDPGMGKSVLTQTLGDQPGMSYCPAGTFHRANRPEALIAQGERIIVDGLDEIASSTPGGAVDSVLRQLSRMDGPPFILSCREADWRGATDRVQIEDDYGEAPLLLHLRPFSHDDALAFLADRFPAVDPVGIVHHLADRGLESFYQNPLTLRLLGEVAQETGLLPERRAELFERACTVMLREENTRHQDDPHVHRTDEELLLAASAMCATQILCARGGVFAGSYADTPDDCVNIADVTRLSFGEPAEDALRTRLFHADGVHRFTHVHRVVAEFLGAKWLARCFEAGRSERRIFSLFRSGDGVPTSLRGLHAWMAHFNAGLAIRCIASDPYAVLRYGDAETIGLDQARALLCALKMLSETDPYFASEDWGRHPASGLMRSESKEDVLAVIGTPGRHTHLAILLLSAMPGTELAEELRETLTHILFDPARTYAERSYAADAIRASPSAIEWEAVIHQLLAEEADHAARLACDILKAVGANAVSLETGVEAVLAHLGLTERHIAAPNTAVARHVDKSLFLDLDTARLARLLDMIADRAGPFMGRADFSAKRQITTLVRRLALAVLEADPTTAPERIWAWLEWLEGSRPYNDVERERLAELFARQLALRAALLEHVLLTPCANSTSIATHRLHQTRLGLYPTDEDLVVLLRAVRARAGGGPVDADLWRDLLRLGRSNDAMADIVHDAAVETAGGAPELLDILDQMTRIIEPEWNLEHERLDAEDEARRQEMFQAHRDHHTQRAREIAAGSVGALASAAEVYLGRDLDFDDSASPVARLHELLGDPLTDQALAGFVAVLGRGDLPTAAQIARGYAESKFYFAEGPMICGIAEMLRQGRPIDALDCETLAAVYMAWQRAPESGTEAQIDIGPALEEALFRNERDVEIHLRTSMEPQLASRVEHPFELSRLTHEPRWAPLVGRLCAEWLQRFPEQPLRVATELISSAVKNAPRAMLEDLFAAWTASDAHDEETMLLWLSAAFVVEFDRRRDELDEAAAAHRDFLWRIRDRLEEKHQVVMSHLSISQLAFIVEAFAPHWPSVARPPGGVWGNRHPWDATMFIERTIHETASRPTPEATEALQHLIDGPALTYGQVARHALALQRKARRDFEYAAPSIGALRAVLADDLPETIDDMRAYLADRIETVQARMHGANTDTWTVYWFADQPRHENFCRDRLVEQLSLQLPESIRLEPEHHMPGQRRADFVAIRNAIGLPVEIKGQWHSEVWDAASDQLDAHYAREWRAQGRGVYIVFWFGDLPRKRLPRHPGGLDRPDTPQALRQMLLDRLPEARRRQIDVFVIDVTPPGGAA